MPTHQLKKIKTLFIVSQVTTKLNLRLLKLIQNLSGVNRLTGKLEPD